MKVNDKVVGWHEKRLTLLGVNIRNPAEIISVLGEEIDFQRERIKELEYELSEARTIKVPANETMLEENNILDDFLNSLSKNGYEMKLTVYKSLIEENNKENNIT